MNKLSIGIIAGLSTMGATTIIVPTAIAVTENNNTKPITLRVMSYNIQHGIDHRSEEKPKPVDLDPVVDIVKKYNPDVLNINEIYDECTKLPDGQQHQVEYLGQKLGYNYYFVKGDVITWMDNGIYGGAILSKYPMSFLETHPIPNPVSKPDMEKRAIGKVTISLPNHKTVDIVQSHFGGISSEAAIRAEERQNAIDTLLPLVKENKSAIFMGDLNLVAGQEESMPYVNQIKAVMTETIDESLPTFDSLNPTEHIDYMFCSPGMDYYGGTVLSDVYADHLPIMCEFNI